MDYSELVKSRYSCRAYTSEHVPDELVTEILEAGRMSPSAKNIQPVSVIAVRTKQGLSKVNEACNTYGAPLALIVCVDMEGSWESPYTGKHIGETDAAIVTTQMMYRAEELGLGSVWIGMFDPERISSAFGLGGLTPINILAVGYKADTTSGNHGVRKAMEEFAKFA